MMLIELQRRLDDRSIMRRFESFFVSVFMITLLVCMSIGAYWLFVDTKTPINSKVVETMDTNGIPTTVFKRGSIVLVLREICFDSPEILFFSRVFTNRKTKVAYQMPSGPVQVEEGCRRSINRVHIPEFLEPGEYDYVVSVHYENNLFIEGTVVLPVPKITVIL